MLNTAKIGFYSFQPNFPTKLNAICLKLFRNMPLFWYLIFRKSSCLKKPAWNSSSMQVFLLFYYFLSLIAYNSIFAKSIFSLKLDFLKIKFQNRSISLNSFKYGAFCWKVWLKGVKPNFGPKTCHVLHYTILKALLGSRLQDLLTNYT